MNDYNDIVDQLTVLTSSISEELAKYQAKQTKASAKRIRALTIAQSKVAKEFRAMSVLR